MSTLSRKESNRIDDFLWKELDPAFARRARFVASSLASKKTAHVLDVGCGRGFYEQFLPGIFPKLTIVAVDTNEEYLKKARKNVTDKRVTFVHGNGDTLPFRAKTFDAVIISEVLEHVREEYAFLAEIRRILKPGGKLIVTVPSTTYPFVWDPVNWLLERLFHLHMPSHIWWLAGIWADHQRLYTTDQLGKVLKTAGFSLTHMEKATHTSFPFAHFLLYGIGKNIVERKLLPEFYRFETVNKPSMLFRFVRRLLYAFDRLNDSTTNQSSSAVNILATATL